MRMHVAIHTARHRIGCERRFKHVRSEGGFNCGGRCEWIRSEKIKQKKGLPADGSATQITSL